MHLVENCRLDFIYTVYNGILLEDSQIRHATKSMIDNTMETGFKLFWE
jgi:hypothetical protein